MVETPASVRAAALGNAPYLLGGGAELLFYAPALIGRTGGFATGMHRHGADGTVATLAGAGSVGLGDFAVGLQYQNFGNDAPHSGFAASVGYARELVGGVAAGVVAKQVEGGSERPLDPAGSPARRAFMLDLGLAREFGPAMASLSVRNLGSGLEGARGEVRRPRQVALGISTESFEAGPLDLFLTSQILRRDDGEVIPSGGVEVSWWPVQGYTFRLRAGVQRVTADDERRPFTFGAAFTGDALTLEYAFQHSGPDGHTHRFGLRLR